MVNARPTVHPGLRGFDRLADPIQAHAEVMGTDEEDEPSDAPAGSRCGNNAGFAQRRRKLGRASWQQHHGFFGIAPCGRFRGSETGCELAERLGFAEVGQHRQRLAARVQQPPPRPDRPTTPTDDPRRVVQPRTR